MNDEGLGSVRLMDTERRPSRSTASPARSAEYSLEHQVGFLLRKAHQRHRSIFSRNIGAPLAPTQFAALVSLYTEGPTSQNQLGRRTAMDTATITGVVDRLGRRDLVTTASSPDDERLTIVDLTPEGRSLIEELMPRAAEISALTVAPLSADEVEVLLALLARIAEA